MKDTLAFKASDSHKLMYTIKNIKQNKMKHNWLHSRLWFCSHYLANVPTLIRVRIVRLGPKRECIQLRSREMKQTVEESERFCIVVFSFFALGKHFSSNNSNVMSPKDIHDYDSHQFVLTSTGDRSLPASAHTHKHSSC